jgi:hypothetical protein
MGAALLITLREGPEAALMVAVVMACLRQLLAALRVAQDDEGPQGCVFLELPAIGPAWRIRWSDSSEMARSA